MVMSDAWNQVLLSVIFLLIGIISWLGLMVNFEIVFDSTKYCIIIS